MNATDLRQRLPAGELLTESSNGEQNLVAGPKWLLGMNPQQNLTFLGVADKTGQNFGVLLEIDFEDGLLRYLPLQADETPLIILTNNQRRVALKDFVRTWTEGQGRFAKHIIREVPLEELPTRLVSPISQPRQVFAIAANYPSHLFTDLALPERRELIDKLRQARPRIFWKYPPVLAPGESIPADKSHADLPGPFDTIAAPPQVHIPTLNGMNRMVSGHLDYEVEMAVLIGRNLTWDQIRQMEDKELRAAVAGYLLLSDAKVRDPQAMGKIIQAFLEKDVPGDNAYRVDDEALDGTLGVWDETTCQWWSYAASWGRYAAHGPFLVASEDSEDFPSRMILAARSYSSSVSRPIAAPRGVPTDQFLLRQATLTTTAAENPDALIWDVPAIIRSLLNPAGNALAFSGQETQLYAGDLIALGTPGGTVISAKPWWLLPIAEDLLFWKEPEGFYDMFFAPTKGYYLHPGDELFLWGEGMGYQHLKVSIPGAEE